MNEKQISVEIGRPEKVTNGGNLLNKDRDSLLKIRLASTQTERKRLPMVGTFLNEGIDSLLKIR
jgi:hypothetical protein